MNDCQNPTSSEPAKHPWLSAWKVYLQPESLRMLSLGFAAGLPFLLVLGTLSFRLREAGISLETIGYLSWIGLAYGFKWVWAPLVDRLNIVLLTSLLGRRRSWLLVSQVMIMLGLIAMGLSDPQVDLRSTVYCAIVVAFASATQDIALDAFRIESVQAQFQAALAASYQTGYRLAMIWSGAGALWIAAHFSAADTYDSSSWQTAYFIMALSMLAGLITVLFSAEPAPIDRAPACSVKQWLTQTLIDPFSDFVSRYQWQAVIILGLIAIYRISDIVMGIMANPFYVDMGYTKDEVASITKIFGVIMTLAGAYIGGVLSMRLGIMRILMGGAILSSLTNILFSWLARQGHDVSSLIWVISADNLASGMASAAFVAYLSSLTNIQYSATQYALFSSMMVILPKWLAGFSGKFVDTFGYETFFNTTALLGLPVLALVWAASRVTPLHSSMPQVKVTQE
jgi:MFS transporter, PAT family, beta-lactamase induction signal transducer AmpG